MKYIIHAVSTVLALLALTACTLQEVQKFSYNSGSTIGCKHANDNLPNEEQLDMDCLQKQGDGMSYEEYIEIRNEADTK
jgi:hypothetical protein